MARTYDWVLIAAVVVVLVLPGLISAGVDQPPSAPGPGPASTSRSTGSLVPSPASPAPQNVTASPEAGAGAGNESPANESVVSPTAPGPPAGQVTDTLVVENRTFVPGNFPSENEIVPDAVAYGPGPTNGAGYIYVAGLYSANVSVISDVTDRVVATIAVGGSPDGVVFDSVNGYVYVTNGASDNVSVISPATRTVVGTVPLEFSPVGVAFNPASGDVYVAGGHPPVVATISGANNTVVASAPVSGPGIEASSASALVYDGANGYVYVGVGFDGWYNVSVLDPANGTVLETLSLPWMATAFAYDDADSLVYVAVGLGIGGTHLVSQTVVVLNGTSSAYNASANNGTLPNAYVGNVTAGGNPIGVAYDSANDYVYVANAYSDNVTVIDGAKHTIVAPITVGPYPTALAYDPWNGCVYVANGGSDTMTVIDDLSVLPVPTGPTPGVVGSIPVGIGPWWALTYDSTNGYVYVANYGSDSVTVIAGATDSVVRTIRVGSDPDGVVYDNRTGVVYVANCGSNNVTLINASTDKVAGAIPVSHCPKGMAYDSSTDTLYVTQVSNRSVALILDTTNTVTRSILVGLDPDAAAFDSATGEVYVADEGSAEVTVIDGANDTVVGSILVGDPSLEVEPVAVAYDSANGYVYVANAGGGENVTVINGLTGSIIAGVLVGGEPTGVAYDSWNGDVVATVNSGNVTILSGTTISAVVSTDTIPISVTYDRSNGYVYTVNQVTNNVTVVRIATSLTTGPISLGVTPEGLAYDPGNAFVYLAVSSSNSVTVLDGPTDHAVGSIPVGQQPEAVAYDSRTGDLFVANAGSNNVTVINGLTNTVVGSISVGTGPNAIVYDSGNGLLYVANGGSDNVTVVNGTTDKVVESVAVFVGPDGLAVDSSNPRAAYWSIYVANGDTDTVQVINGTTNTLTTFGDGLSYITVGGAPSAVVYASLSRSVYVASGAGLGSAKAFTAPGPLGCSASEITEINGTTNEVVQSITAPYCWDALAYDGANGYLYAANEGVPHTTDGPDNVTVISGWSNAVVGSVPVGSGPDALAYVPAAGTMGHIYVANYGSGSVSRILPQVTYPATFSEIGLPTDTRWWVNITGEPAEGSKGTTMATELPNGTYTYVVGTTAKQYSAPVGSFTVAGASPAPIEATFTLVEYSVTFQETGLPVGTDWSVYLSYCYQTQFSGTYSSTTPTIDVPEPNGTFCFQVLNAPGHFPSPQMGGFGISGSSPTPVIITFSAMDLGNLWLKLISQYAGQFIQGVTVWNTFGINTTICVWVIVDETQTCPSVTPAAAVTGAVGDVGLSFTYVGGSQGLWNSTPVNMGSLGPHAVLNITATYPNGSYTQESYPIGNSILKPPDFLSWVESLAGKTPKLTSPTHQEWYNSYSLKWDASLNLAPEFSVGLAIASFLGAGNYTLLPAFDLSFTFVSNGASTLSGTFHFATTKIAMGPVEAQFSATITAEGDFTPLNGTLYWANATLTIRLGAFASMTVPIYGYAFNIPYYGTVFIGLSATISLSASVAVTLVLEATSDPSHDFIANLPLMLTDLYGSVSIALTLAINVGIGIASITGGGTLNLTMFWQDHHPYIEGGFINGTVFLGWSVLIWSGTLWSESGVLYSWGTDSPSLVSSPGGALARAFQDAGDSNGSNLSLIPRNYNTTNYNRPAWSTGAYEGVAVEDVYPYTTVSLAGGSSGALAFYTTDNVSKPETQGLSLDGLAFDPSSRALESLSVPVPSYEVALGPKAVDLPNGSTAVVWNAIPLAEMLAAGPLSITNSVLQLAYYDPAAHTWSGVTNLTSSGFSRSYAVDSSAVGTRILDLEANGLMGGTEQLVELSSSGAVLHSQPVVNASTVVSFRGASDLAVVRTANNSSFTVLNLSTGAEVPLDLGVPGNATEVSSVQGSASLLQALFAGAGGDTLVVYNASSGLVVGAYPLPSNVSSLAATVYDGRLLVTAVEPHQIVTYVVSGDTAQRLASETAQNVTSLTLAVSGTDLVVIAAEKYGTSSAPLLNLSLVDVPLAPPTVTFQETGLPTGTGWFVNVTGGASYSSTTDTITFREPNGTYDYTLGSADTSYGAAGGSFGVAGTAVSEAVAFSPETFAATFTESGLPPGTAWWVNITGETPVSATGTTVTASLPNGTFAYSAGTADKEYSASGGSLSMSGGRVSALVAFRPVLYGVTFTETGLPSGTTWWVLFDGALHYSTGSTLTLEESNATYGFTVVGVNGYSGTPSSGAVTVNGTSAAAGVTFAATLTPPGRTFLGLPSVEGYALVGGIVVVAAVAVAAFSVARRRRRASTSPPPKGPPPTR